MLFFNNLQNNAADECARCEESRQMFAEFFHVFREAESYRLADLRRYSKAVAELP